MREVRGKTKLGDRWFELRGKFKPVALLAIVIAAIIPKSANVTSVNHQV